MRHLDFACSPAYRRLRAIGHPPGCTCEECFVFIERVIQKLFPGFFPADPLELRIKEMEKENAELRDENERLHKAIQTAEPRIREPLKPQNRQSPTATFEPVVIG